MQKSLKKNRPMSGLSYPTIDLESDIWVEQTIHSEIIRGRQLHREKSLSSERSNSIFSKFPKLANGGTRERRKTPKWNRRMHATSPIPKNARMSASTSRDGSFRSYRSPRMDRPACSMRITELAVPSKRQCIASWRANSNILPANMINRLKERVTDQVPIVKVSDAVNCLKYDKRSSHGRDKVDISSDKRPSRKINKEAMNNRIQAENQILSDAFGMKIAQLLMTPMVIKLNSQLQNVCNIISEEIYNIIKNNKTFKIDKKTNKRMVREISEKVTIWIGKILEDSKEKLLEEELKVLKAKHIPMITLGRLVTLIEVTTHEESELEEQEGPVLDVLDDMIDNILHKCIITPSDNVTPEFVSICSSDNDKDDTDRHLSDEKTSQADETSEVGGIKVNYEDTIENDIKKQLSEVINSLDQDNSDISEDTIENDIKKQINEVISTLKHAGSEKSIGKFGDTIQSETYQPDNDKKHNQPDVKLEPDIDVLYSKDTKLILPDEQNYDDQNISVNEDINEPPDLNVTDEKENNIPSEIEENLTPLPSVNEVSGFPISQNENTDDKKPDNEIALEPDEIKIIDDDVESASDTNEEQTSNVSDAIEIITDGLSEEKNKKVKFSHENLDPMKDKEQYYLINSRENLHPEDEQLLDNITNYERPNIDFAPPNDHLLSDADESWPDKPPVTKPSASVTRSISSMGRIVESEEKLSIALDNDMNHFPENTNPIQGSLEYHENSDGLKEHKNEEQQDVSNLPKEREDLEYVNEINSKIVQREPDEDHSSKKVIEVMKTDGSRFIVQDTPEVPRPRESENLNISLAEVKQNVSDENIQKEESVEDTRNKVESEAIVSSPFVAIFSKWQKYDSTVSLKKPDVSKSADCAKDDTVHGQINQGDIISDGIPLSKFDYRVHPKTAPAWIRRGQGDPNGNPCACSRFQHPDTNKMKDREREILKWGRNLDFILLKLDKWKNFLNYISKYITTLKHKAATCNVGKNSGAGKHKHSIRTDTDIKWKKLNHRAKGGPGLEVQRRDSTVKLKVSPSPVTYCTTCGRTKSNRTKKQRSRSHSRNVSVSKCKRHYEPECLNRNQQNVFS